MFLDQNQDINDRLGVPTISSRPNHRRLYYNEISSVYMEIAGGLSAQMIGQRRVRSHAPHEHMNHLTGSEPVGWMSLMGWSRSLISQISPLL